MMETTFKTIIKIAFTTTLLEVGKLFSAWTLFFSSCIRESYGFVLLFIVLLCLPVSSMNCRCWVHALLLWEASMNLWF